MKEATVDFSNVTKEITAAVRYENEQLLAKYPPDIPNNSGHHALIKGISFENSFNPYVGEYNFLFETSFEKIYIWTHTTNESSALISDIDLSVKELHIWKTVGSMINLSLAYYRAFENIDFDTRLDYKIIYYFSPSSPFEDIEFANVSSLESVFLRDGLRVKATEIAELAPMIDLIGRDDRCFTAVSLLLSSFQIHYCCLICELGLTKYKSHESHEPEIWEQADSLTSYESAIVQACRCVESILGEPPKQTKLNRVNAHKARWFDLTGINPESTFERTKYSYWEFYVVLFDELRNPSAHSFGEIHENLRRQHVIDAQCFAAIILRGYIEKNLLDFEEALDALKFNRAFLNRVNPNISTKKTNCE